MWSISLTDLQIAEDVKMNAIYKPGITTTRISKTMATTARSCWKWIHIYSFQNFAQPIWFEMSCPGWHFKDNEILKCSEVVYIEINVLQRILFIKRIHFIQSLKRQMSLSTLNKCFFVSYFPLLFKSLFASFKLGYADHFLKFSGV